MKKRSFLTSAGFLLLTGVAIVLALAPRGSHIHAYDPDSGHWHGKTTVTHSHEIPSDPLSGVACTAGFAGPYPCKNVDLLSYLPMNAVAASTSADIWGWTDPLTGREYAILSHGNATTFVDISDPTLPVIVGDLPAPVLNYLWRDVKVYRNHAYIVGDSLTSDEHGLQIFDLTQLRDVVAPAVFTQTARYTGFGRAHNIAINGQTGYAYVVGSTTCSGGFHMLDLSDPANPVFAGCFSEDEYTHDVQCVIYSGPDSEHQGSEICLAANEDTLTIVDVTDKNAARMLSRTPYAGSEYTHQGWLTEDHAYFVLGDELDELFNGHNTHSYIFNLSDLDAPVHIGTYVGPTTSIDHNLFIRDGLVYESNYTSGLRILETSDIANGNLTEIAYFDTHPADDAAAFAGTWSNYPFFESGVVILSNIEDGLFVLKPNLPVSVKATGGGWLEAQDGKKINLSFDLEQTGSGSPSGSLKLNDRIQNVKVEISSISVLRDGSASCSMVSGSQVVEIFGHGTFNGEAASFRSCAADNGNPGKGQDQFYLECTSDCGYTSASSAVDQTIDGGNLQVSVGSDSADASNLSATTMILDPLLLSEGLVGQLQVFTVKVYDQNQDPMADATVTLTRFASDGGTETLTALTDLTGTAVFSLVNLNQMASYLASAGRAESNTIELGPILQ